MTALRILLRRSPLLAALVVTAALLLRVVVPGGFMPVMEHGRVVLTLCSGMAAPAQPAAMPGMAHHGSDEAPLAAGKCAYADLAQAMTGSADPILLAAALAFVLALALALDLALPPLFIAWLRPPLRGPPLPA